jgi:outer membrane lipoprotein-sorting protein
VTALASRPALRWLVPVGVLVVVLGGAAAVSAVRASAASGLPPRSAAQLLADLRGARLDHGTGTVVEHADLGLPALPDGTGGDGSSDWQSLIVGAHTLRVWYDGPDLARIALVGSLGESDVIHNGQDLWTWSSNTNTATHVRLPAAPAQAPSGLPSAGPSIEPSHAPLTPMDAANDVLAALSPTTSVTSAGSVTVADRSAYQLVIAPKDKTSLVGSVRIAVDSARHIPLRVQVFAAGVAKPAFEIGFTQVSFAQPDRDVFTFNPPPGAKITQATPSAVRPPTKPPTGSAPDQSAKPKVIGSGWTAVVETTLPADLLTPNGKPNTIDTLLKELPTVHGSFGTGRVLQTVLFSALITDDGHLYVGAVSGANLVTAADNG